MIPKSLGINPNICRLDQANANFQNIINEITNGTTSRPVRFRLTEDLDTGSNAAAVLLSFNGTYGPGDTIQVFDFYALSPDGSGGRGMWQAATGAEGWAVRREEPLVTGRAEFDIVWMEQYAGAIEFTLTSAFTAGVASATVTASWDQGIAPGETINVHDDQDLFADAISGDKGKALRSEYAAPTTPETPYYKVIYLPPSTSGTGVIRFKLTAGLNTGSSAAAVKRIWDGAAYADSDAITVYDWWSVSGGLRGMWQAASGAEGLARAREGSSTDFDIIWMEQYASAIEFELTSVFTLGVASATVSASWEQGLAPGSPLNVHDDNDNFAHAAIGDKGTALRSEYADPNNPGTPYYKVVYLPPPAATDQQPVRFRLTANLVTGGTAAAVIRTWNGAAYVNGAAISVTDWWAISQGGRGMYQGVTNMEGWARRIEGSETDYDIIWMEQYAWGVECTISSGSGWVLEAGSATATVTASYEQGVEPGETITIHDDIGMFPRARNGAKCICRRSEYADAANPDVPYYKVIACQQVALTARALLSEDMCQMGEIEISEFQVTSPSPFNQDIAPTTAFNDFNHRGLVNSNIWLAWDDDLEAYVIIDVTKQAAGMVTDVRVSGSCLEADYYSEVAFETCEIEETKTLICWAPCEGEGGA